MQKLIQESIIQCSIQRKQAELDREAATVELGKWQSRVELGINSNRPDMVQYAVMRVRYHTNNLKLAIEKAKKCEAEMELLKSQLRRFDNERISFFEEEFYSKEFEYEIIDAEIIGDVETIGIDHEELEDLRRQLDNL
jgi:phage shock protein A